MSKSNLSFFDEKRRVSKFKTDWGFWWQTVSEVHIEVNIPSNTSAKDIKVKVNPKFISCTIKGNVIFEVIFKNLFKIILIYVMNLNFYSNITSKLNIQMYSYVNIFILFYFTKFNNLLIFE